MTLTQVNIHNVRNIKKIQMNLHPNFNVFYGSNGSGKTSILEAIYLLGSGRSFKTRETTPILSFFESSLTVFAKIDVDDTLSIQKSTLGSTKVKINQQICSNTSSLATYLPCQLFYQDMFQIIDTGPAVRRSLLDWGLFYKENNYNNLIKEYRHVLKQRNSLLKQKAKPFNFIPWDKLLVDLAVEIDILRDNYFKIWSITFQDFLEQLTSTYCTIKYYKGWDKKNLGLDYKAILAEKFNQDLQYQYTSAGPHNADIIFDSVELKAKQVLSRGQQKIILIALKLAQASLLQKPCIYLFDDVIAELDLMHIENLLKCLAKLKGQFFFTAIDATPLINSNHLENPFVFKVDNGSIKPITNSDMELKMNNYIYSA
jgi:DNA replication and repair protein RecF